MVLSYNLLRNRQVIVVSELRIYDLEHVWGCYGLSLKQSETFKHPSVHTHTHTIIRQASITMHRSQVKYKILNFRAAS